MLNDTDIKHLQHCIELARIRFSSLGSSEYVTGRT